MRRRLAAVALAGTLALSTAGCAIWPVSRAGPIMLMNADRLADQGEYRAAMIAYDEFLRRHPDDAAAPRALASRDNVAAIVTTRDELARLREEVVRLREELARRDADLVRVRQELAARQADADRLRADLERLKEIDLKLERTRR
jgi:TolA-binding protein